MSANIARNTIRTNEKNSKIQIYRLDLYNKAISLQIFVLPLCHR